jgi:glutamyl-tRNA synthetase
MVRTRFAPSPTGFLHIGGARTALFAWAFARHHGGTFILRIEDTDLERSTPEATQAILDGMHWLGLEADEGPFFQTQRMARYREVIGKMLAEGTAYRCWCSKEELEQMRARQEELGLKPRYDGRWRPEAGRILPAPPSDVPPVVRFRNPLDGATSWNDTVKGPIAIDNAELDDLVIARSDGTPTYNFCVVVDDWDMRITHVLRGDDHVNNTPRQINILRALGAPVPEYGHLPMIHGADGQKLSKRHGAVSVMQYDEDGYLPEAIINYLARLGWSHGDDEIFSREQFVAWFDGAHISRSPARFDFDKLRWLNNHYLKESSDLELARRVAPRLERAGVSVPVDGAALPVVCGLLKERAQTLDQLAELTRLFYVEPDLSAIAPADRDKHLTGTAREAVEVLARQLAALAPEEWTAPSISAALKATLGEQRLKMPQLAVPVRLLVFGVAQTPSVDAMLAAMPKHLVLARLARWPL